MALKIVKRAPVNEHFLNLMFNIYQRWMQSELQNAEHYPGGKKAYLRNNQMRLVRIRNLLNGGDGDGRSGKSYEITKLRALGYADYKAVRHDEINYLVGETQPIIIEVPEKNGRRIPGGTYHLGPYRVYVGEDAILRGNMDQIHFIPLKAPDTQNRFMHHKAISNGETHPLSYDTSTCWGDIGSAIKSYAADADVPELFRGLLFYMTRYNINSPLVNIHQMGWDVKTPWEQYRAH